MVFILCTIMLFACDISIAIPNATFACKTTKIDMNTQERHLFQLSDDEIKRVRDLVANYSTSISLATNLIVTGQTKSRRKGRAGWRHKKRKVKFKKIFRKHRYPTPAERLTLFYTHFLNLFSGNDELKKNLLNSTYQRPRSLDGCYMQVFRVFMKHCNYAYYNHGGTKVMKNFLSRLCWAEWLNVENITYIFESTCRHRFTFDTDAL